MIAEAVRRSPLADYAERFTALYERSNGTVSIRELPFVTQFNLRADPQDTALMQSLQANLGFPLPVLPNTVTNRDDRRALWLGPDEWLIVGPEGQDKALEQTLRTGLNGAFGAVVDVSANRTVLQVRGPAAGDLLAHAVPIDLHPRVFPAGRCAQTLLAKAQVIVERLEEDPGFHLYIRSSFAAYVADWLLDAAGS